jgi:hypothetical protein
MINLQDGIVQWEESRLIADSPVMHPSQATRCASLPETDNLSKEDGDSDKLYNMKGGLKREETDEIQ